MLSQKKVFTLLLWVVLFPLLACSEAIVKDNSHQSTAPSAQAGTCIISASEREALLNLDYNSFDQSLPDGGWRKYQQCPFLTRELIDAYTARHESTLQKQQWDVLVWHSGQISAMAGDYADAIAKMEKTFKPNEKPTDSFLWNPYAAATIAFLKKEKRVLIRERSKLARGHNPFNSLNLRHVDAFIRCFDSSYLAAYSEKCDPPETNIERIRSLAVPFDIKKPLPKGFFGLSDFLAMRKIILVGEIHGTSTVPKLFGNIVAAIASQKTRTLVFLEIPQTSQSAIDRFLETGDEVVLKDDPFFTRKYQDGRSSASMVALIHSLSKLPGTTVLCMDPQTGDNKMTDQERDTDMASFINSKRVGYDHVLILSGNIHSSTSIGTAWDKGYRPMGYELKKMARDLTDDQWLNILMRYGKVDAWNCQGTDTSSCKAYYGSEKLSDYSKAVPFSSYFVWDPDVVDGHNASIFIRDAKISFPFLMRHMTSEL